MTSKSEIKQAARASRETGESVMAGPWEIRAHRARSRHREYWLYDATRPGFPEVRGYDRVDSFADYLRQLEREVAPDTRIDWNRFKAGKSTRYEGRVISPTGFLDSNEGPVHLFYLLGHGKGRARRYDLWVATGEAPLLKGGGILIAEDLTVDEGKYAAEEWLRTWESREEIAEERALGDGYKYNPSGTLVLGRDEQGNVTSHVSKRARELDPGDRIPRPGQDDFVVSRVVPMKNGQLRVTGQTPNHIMIVPADKSVQVNYVPPKLSIKRLARLEEISEGASAKHDRSDAWLERNGYITKDWVSTGAVTGRYEARLTDKGARAIGFSGGTSKLKNKLLR